MVSTILEDLTSTMSMLSDLTSNLRSTLVISDLPLKTSKREPEISDPTSPTTEISVPLQLTDIPPMPTRKLSKRLRLRLSLSPITSQSQSPRKPPANHSQNSMAHMAAVTSLPPGPRNHGSPDLTPTAHGKPRRPKLRKPKLR